MNNKRNIIVMFLFVMLSFAIISQVSAVSDAEADGTGFDPSVKSVNMNDHDIASERTDDKFMQDHDDDYMDDLKSPNEQNSFNNSPQFGDKNIENRNFYEHPVDNSTPLDVPQLPDRMDNMSGELREDNFTPVLNGEGMKNIIPNINGGGNMSMPKPIDSNISNQMGPENNKAPVLPNDVNKNNGTKLDKEPAKPKAAKKLKAKAVKKAPSKTVKKVSKKPKSTKKVSNRKSKTVQQPKLLNNSSNKERTKL